MDDGFILDEFGLELPETGFFDDAPERRYYMNGTRRRGLARLCERAARSRCGSPKSDRVLTEMYGLP